MAQIAQRIAIGLALVVQFAFVSNAGGLFADEYACIDVLEQAQESFEGVSVKNIIGRLAYFPIEQQMGRFMPLVRPLQYAELLAFGDNFVARHWFECLLWFLSSMALFELARRMTRSPGAGLLAGMFVALAWPLGLMVVRVHRTEPIFVALQIVACICIWHAEDRSRIQTYLGRAQSGMLTFLAIECVWLSLLFKETALPILPALFAFGVIGFIFRPRHARRVYIALTVGSAFMGWRMVHYILGPSRELKGYASSYEVSRFSVMIEQLDHWHQTFFSGYGPMLVLALVLCVLRAVNELRRGTLSRTSHWRLTLLIQSAAFIALHIPWPRLAARYAYPGFAIVGLLIACEIADLWRWSAIHRKRTAPDSQRVALPWIFLVACALWWMMPYIQLPLSGLPIVLDSIATIALVILWMNIARARRTTTTMRRATNHHLARAVRVGLITAMLLFVVVSIPTRYSQILQGKGVAFGMHGELFEKMEALAPENGRVVIGYEGRDWGRNFIVYQKRYHDRRDYEIFSKWNEKLQLRPQDMLIQRICDEEVPPPFPPALDPAGREFIEINRPLTFINPPRYIHCSWVPEFVGGWSRRPESREPKRWITTTRADYGWRIYFPVGVLPSAGLLK